MADIHMTPEDLETLINTQVGRIMLRWAMLRLVTDIVLSDEPQETKEAAIKAYTPESIAKELLNARVDEIETMVNVASNFLEGHMQIITLDLTSHAVETLNDCLPIFLKAGFKIVSVHIMPNEELTPWGRGKSEYRQYVHVLITNIL